jgi:hypothetical protein
VDLCTVSWCDGCFCLDWSIPNCKLESPPIPDPIYIEPGGSPPPAVIVPITSPPTILILAQTDGGILSSFYFFAENQTGLSFELPSDGLQIWSFDLDGSFKPPVIVDLPYLEEDLLPDIDENRLAIFHVTNEGWVLLPSVVDTNNNRVSAKSLSLGVFALGIVSKGDFDRDGDVDGSDLEMLIKASDMNLLPDFALNFGKMVGP